MTYILTLISLVVLDSVWLFIMAGHYKKWLAGLFASNFNLYPAALFYLIYAAALSYFVIMPAIKNQQSIWMVFVTGFFFGLAAYATYDLTNQATLKDWPIFVTCIDMLWGAVLAGLTSLIVTYFLA
jgi:uncharacterized membrane protein